MKPKRSFFLVNFLLAVFISFSQKDSVKWHCGAFSDYASVIYPSRAPYLLYEYSDNYGIGIFSENQFKKNGKWSLTASFGFDVLNLHQKLPALDTNVFKFPPNENAFIYKKVTFKYNIYSLMLSLDRKITKRYKLGLGISAKAFFIKEKKGYDLYSYTEFDFKTNQYIIHTVDYTFSDGPNVLTYISLNNTFLITRNMAFQLNLIINPLSYWDYKHAKYDPMGYIDAFGNIYGGPKAGVMKSSVNFITYSYIFYIR